MKFRSFLIVTAVIALCATVSREATADANCNSLNVAAAEIPHFIESDEKGVFVELLRTAATRANLDVNIRVYPKRRALNLFQSGSVNTLLPHSSAGVVVPSVKSDPILIKRDFVFVRAGTPVPRSASELEGLRIGLTKQYAYSKDLTSNKNIEFSDEPNSDLDNIKMLSIGRFDGSIIEERSGQKAIVDAAVDNIIYDRNHPISEFQVWILFSDNDCGRSLSERVNAAFGVMKSDGTWDTILPPPGSNSGS